MLRLASSVGKMLSVLSKAVATIDAQASLEQVKLIPKFGYKLLFIKEKRNTVSPPAFHAFKLFAGRNASVYSSWTEYFRWWLATEEKQIVLLKHCRLMDMAHRRGQPSTCLFQQDSPRIGWLHSGYLEM